MIEYRLPELGEDIETGDLISILVSPGDYVSDEQPLLELETDKAALEIPSPGSGLVKEIHVEVGEKIKIGQLLITIDDAAELNTDDAPEEPLDNSDEEENSTNSGSKKKDIEVNTDQGRFESAAKSEVVAVETGDDVTGIIPVPASPSVRRTARELGVQINKVTGTGPSGRISEDDVRTYIHNIKPAIGNTPTTDPAPAEPIESDKWGEVNRLRMSKVRRITAEHLIEAWKAPHVTQFDKADVTELEKLRKQYRKSVAEAGGKLTMTSIILKVIVYALRQFPEFNASIDMVNGEIIYKNYYNIGVAVDTDRGLLVPVIKNADQKNIKVLSVELNEISERARTKKISIEDLRGGTFTVSNLGGLGGTYFTPVLNSPEVAILGISRSVVEPVYNGNDFEPRLMLPLSLSYDHRLIDGADAIKFLRWVVEALEQPFKLLLEN